MRQVQAALNATLAQQPFPRRLIFPLLFTSIYIIVIAYFNVIDVYHRHFFDAQHAFAYAAFRTAFTLYLFWIVYYPGRRLLQLIDMREDIGRWNEFSVGFFVGAALWTLLMLFLGYLGLYTRTIAVLITVPVVAASAGHFCDTARDAMRHVGHLRLRDSLTVMLSAVAIVFGILLMMVKGLYPAGGHDYFTHYFYYLLSVIKHHNIWPNEVWYHYYYSKGLGVFFLGMLLTDPLAPSLATYCFVAAAAIALFDLVRRFNAGTAWPWVAVILYLAFFIHTPGKGFYAVHGGWGDFHKPHETSSAFLIALLWMSARLIGAAGVERRAWCVAAALCAFVLASVTTASSFLSGLFFSLMLTGCLVLRQWRNAAAFLGLGVATTAGLVAVLALNYVTSGLPLDNGIEFFWPIIDLRRLMAWGVLPEVVETMAGRLVLFRDAIPLASQDMRLFVTNVVRADLLRNIYYVSAVAAFAWAAHVVLRSIRARTISGTNPFPALHLEQSALGPLAASLALFASMICVACVIGRSQAVSYVRYTSFALPLMLAITLGGWQIITNSLPRSRRLRVACGSLVPVALLVVALTSSNADYRKSFRLAVADAASFVGGRYSIYDAYVNQMGWPGRSPDGAIRPWALAVWRHLGPETRFWTFGVHTYCMVPGCVPESMYSFRMSPRSLDILLGPPDPAKAIFQQEGLNYFLIEMDDTLHDQLMCSALFSPDQIKDHLGVEWTDGTHFLLTWLDSGIQLLTPDWIEAYRQKVTGANCGRWPILQSLADQLRHNPRLGADLVMPWSKR